MKINIIGKWFFLFSVLGLIILPLISTLFLSFTNFKFDGLSNETLSFSLEWYSKAYNTDKFREALNNSIGMALILAFTTTIISFIIALTWWNNKKRLTVLFLLLIWGVIPPEVQAVSFISVKKAIDINFLADFFHFSSILFGILPYCILVIWGLFNLLDTNLIRAAKDIGAKNSTIIFSIVFPLSLPATFSVFLLSFLLSLNEYTKTFYLSGANTYLSEYLSGKLQSGTDASIYAAGGFNIGLALIFLLLSAIVYRFLWNR